MNRDDLIAKLHDARALVYQAHEGTDLPQIQMILRHADQNLHWALWNLGVVNSLRPDLPAREQQRAQPKPKPQPKPKRAAAAKRSTPEAKARKTAKPKRRSTARGRTKRR
jgi:hypothetical protein